MIAQPAAESKSEVDYDPDFCEAEYLAMLRHANPHEANAKAVNLLGHLPPFEEAWLVTVTLEEVAAEMVRILPKWLRLNQRGNVNVAEWYAESDRKRREYRQRALNLNGDVSGLN
jgi:hypothetical protein